MVTPTLGAALRSRVFLRSGWPRRTVAWPVVTVVLGLMLLCVLAVPGSPWLVVLGQLETGTVQPVGAVALGVLGAVLLGIVLPPLSLVIRRIEVARAARIEPEIAPVDGLVRTLADHGARGVYSTVGVWRAVAYVVLLMVCWPFLLMALVTIPVLAGGLLLAPLLAMADAPISVGGWQLDHAVESWLGVPIGAASMLALPYAWGALAAVQIRAIRELLVPDGDHGERLRRVSRSRARLVHSFDAERARIERDLHDGAQQQLVSLTMRLGLARAASRPDDPRHDDLVAAHEQAKGLMTELRRLVRGIYPPALSEQGLARSLQEMADHQPWPVRLEVDDLGALPAEVTTALYFGVAEALSNVGKHAEAGRVEVAVTRDRGWIVATIRDDGRGGADPRRGSGLTGIADRLAVADGELSISSPVGGPTVVRMRVPCSDT